jgi:hypothetical protein
MEKSKPDWLVATEKSLRVTYWVMKIALALAAAKEYGWLEFMF